MIFHPINKTRRLQHRLQDQGHRLFIRTTGGRYTGGDAAIGEQLMFIDRSTQHPFPHGLNQGPHILVSKLDVPGKAVSVGLYIHPAHDFTSQLSIGIDVFEIDVQIISRVTETIRPKILGQQLVRRFTDIHADACLHRPDIFGNSQAPHPIGMRLIRVLIKNRINMIHGPDSAILDPFFQHSLLIIGQQLPFIRHFIVKNRQPQLTLIKIPRNDRLATFATFQSAPLPGKIQIPFGRMRIMTLQTMLNDQRSDLLFEKLFLWRRLNHLLCGCILR